MSKEADPTVGAPAEIKVTPEGSKSVTETPLKAPPVTVTAKL